MTYIDSNYFFPPKKPWFLSQFQHLFPAPKLETSDAVLLLFLLPLLVPAAAGDAAVGAGGVGGALRPLLQQRPEPAEEARQAEEGVLLSIHALRIPEVRRKKNKL